MRKPLKRKILTLTFILTFLVLLAMPFAYAVDTEDPTITDISHSTEVADAICNFGMVAEDETALSHYIFYFDNGVDEFTADAAVAFAPATKKATVNVTKTLIASGGKKIQWQWYANDTTNNTKLSGIQTFNTIPTEPTITGITHSAEMAGEICVFGMTAEDETALSHYIFYFDNGGGTLTADPKVAFTSNKQTVTVAKTLNVDDGVTIRWKWYANDTANHTLTSATHSFVTGPTPAQTASNSAVRNYWIALGLVAIIPLILGATVILTMLKSGEGSIASIVVAIGFFVTFAVTMMVGVLIINGMAAAMP